MTALELLIDFHKNSVRQGPGSVSSTLKALDFMHLPTEKELKVADIGCGSGGQTITLAQYLNAEITAVDLFPEFLDNLNEKSHNLGLSSKINTLKCAMEDMPFQRDEFDIIWSEGAIYNMGFERGIKKWFPYLQVGGYLAVSELTWITSSRPKELTNFWRKEYPEIDLASNKIKLLENNGYSLAGYFYLSEDEWLKNYYQPMETRFDAFLKRHNSSVIAKKVVDDHKTEIELYQKYKAYFSYGFYIARKN